MKNKTPICDEVIEKTMRQFAHGNTSLAFTGTKYGISFNEWEKLVVDNILDYKNKRPKCTRNMNWDPIKRLQEIEKLDNGIHTT